MTENGAKVAAPSSVMEDMNNLLAARVATSPFESNSLTFGTNRRAFALLFSKHDSIRDIDAIAKLNGRNGGSRYGSAS